MEGDDITDKTQIGAMNVISKIQENKMEPSELLAYAETQIPEYSNDLEFIVYSSPYRGTTLSEVQLTISKALQQNRFSEYFSRRLADRMSILSALLILFIFAFVFAKDEKDNISELIHTPSIKNYEYVLGKYFGALIAYLSVLLAIVIIMDVYLFFKSISLEWEFSLFDIINYTFVWTVVTVIFLSSLVTAISLCLKNGIATIPVYILYFFSIARPVIMKDGTMGFPINLYRGVIRWDGRFFDVMGYDKVIAIMNNRLFYIVISVIMLSVSVLIWDRLSLFKKGMIKDAVRNISRNKI